METKGKAVVCGNCAVCCRSVESVGREPGECEQASRPLSHAGCNVGTRSEKPKICRCGRGQCKILTSKKDTSRGRRFYCCPQSSGPTNHGCGMFAWVTEDEEVGNSSGAGMSAENQPISPSSNILLSSSLYGRGYLDAAIKASEQQTNALKNILDAFTKMDVKKK